MPQEDPASHEPVSLLGFDPVLSMPSLEDFTQAIKTQKRTLKALLLDQVSTAPYRWYETMHCSEHSYTHLM